MSQSPGWHIHMTHFKLWNSPRCISFSVKFGGYQHFMSNTCWKIIPLKRAAAAWFPRIFLPCCCRSITVLMRKILLFSWSRENNRPLYFGPLRNTMTVPKTKKKKVSVGALPWSLIGADTLFKLLCAHFSSLQQHKRDTIMIGMVLYLQDKELYCSCAKDKETITKEYSNTSHCVEADAGF